MHVTLTKVEFVLQEFPNAVAVLLGILDAKDKRTPDIDPLSASIASESTCKFLLNYAGTLILPFFFRSNDSWQIFYIHMFVITAIANPFMQKEALRLLLAILKHAQSQGLSSSSSLFQL
jgi:hypothetical protein